MLCKNMVQYYCITWLSKYIRWVKTKISIINALISVLDEPTYALDINSLNALKEYLCDIKTNKIIFFVTHDSKLVEFADYVIDLEWMFR